MSESSEVQVETMVKARDTCERDEALPPRNNFPAPSQNSVDAEFLDVIEATENVQQSRVRTVSVLANLRLFRQQLNNKSNQLLRIRGGGKTRTRGDAKQSKTKERKDKADVEQIRIFSFNADGARERAINALIETFNPNNPYMRKADFACIQGAGDEELKADKKAKGGVLENCNQNLVLNNAVNISGKLEVMNFNLRGALTNAVIHYPSKTANGQNDGDRTSIITMMQKDLTLVSSGVSNSGTGKGQGRKSLMTIVRFKDGKQLRVINCDYDSGKNSEAKDKIKLTQDLISCSDGMPSVIVGCFSLKDIADGGILKECVAAAKLDKSVNVQWAQGLDVIIDEVHHSVDWCVGVNCSVVVEGPDPYKKVVPYDPKTYEVVDAKNNIIVPTVHIPPSKKNKKGGVAKMAKKDGHARNYFIVSFS